MIFNYANVRVEAFRLARNFAEILPNLTPRIGSALALMTDLHVIKRTEVLFGQLRVTTEAALILRMSALGLQFPSTYAQLDQVRSKLILYYGREKIDRSMAEDAIQAFRNGIYRP